LGFQILITYLDGPIINPENPKNIMIEIRITGSYFVKHFKINNRCITGIIADRSQSGT
jgi:hypothetical protein